MAKNFKELQAKMSPERQAKSKAKTQEMLAEMAEKDQTSLDPALKEFIETVLVPILVRKFLADPNGFISRYGQDKQGNLSNSSKISASRYSSRPVQPAIVISRLEVGRSFPHECHFKTQIT